MNYKKYNSSYEEDEIYFLKNLEPFQLSTGERLYLPRYSLKTSDRIIETFNYIVLRIMKGPKAVKNYEINMLNSWSNAPLKRSIDENAEMLEKEVRDPKELFQKRVEYAHHSIELVIEEMRSQMLSQNIVIDEEDNCALDMTHNLHLYNRALLLNQAYADRIGEKKFRRLFEESNKCMSVFSDFFRINTALKLHEFAEDEVYEMPEKSLKQAYKILKKNYSLYYHNENVISVLEEIFLEESAREKININ
ncbi:MAG: hypothetical protein QW471_01205 [Candidatus Woesearchaeota archaeon]